MWYMDEKVFQDCSRFLFVERYQKGVGCVCGGYLILGEQ